MRFRALHSTTWTNITEDFLPYVALSSTLDTWAYERRAAIAKATAVFMSVTARFIFVITSHSTKREFDVQNDLSSAIAKSLDAISEYSKQQATKDSSPVLLKQQILRFLHNLNQALSDSHDASELDEQVKREKSQLEKASDDHASLKG